jgi:hypothetical protein
MKTVLLEAGAVARICKRVCARFAKLFGLGPHSAADHIARGDAFFACGDYDKAVAEFTMAIRLEPQSPLGFRRRAAAFEAIGDALQTSLDARKARQLEAGLPHPGQPPAEPPGQ